MKIAKFLVSEEMLVQALHLPDGTRILSVSGLLRKARSDFKITVTHQDLKDVGNYDAVPVVNPSFITEFAEGCNHVVSVELVDWDPD